MRNEPFRLRYANQIVGAFLLLSLVGSTILLVVFARNNRFLAKTVPFYATLSEDQAADLRVGTEVVVLGRAVGQVQSLDYQDHSDQVRLKLAIDSNERELITTVSELSLERKFGVGAMYIKVRRRNSEGATDPEPLALNGLIPIHQERDRVDKMADEITEARISIDSINKAASPAFDSFKAASDTLNDSLANKFNPAASSGEKALESVRIASEKLQVHSQQMTDNMQAMTELLQDFVKNDFRPSLESVTKATESASKASDSLTKTSDGLDKKSEDTNKEIRETLASMRETMLLIQKLTNESREVVQVMRGESNDLPGTTAKINNTADDAQELVDQIRSHWILRGSRKATTTDPIKPSSIRAEGPR